MKDGEKGMRYGMKIGVFTDDCYKEGNDLLLRLTDNFKITLREWSRKTANPLDIAGNAILEHCDREGIKWTTKKLAPTLYLVRRHFVEKQKVLDMYVEDDD